MRFIRLALIGGFIVSPAHADVATSMTNAGLQRICSNAKTADYCKIWMSGFYSGLYMTTINQAMGVKICVQDGVTIGQIVKINNKYLEEHPEALHEPAITGLAVSLSRAFPCKASQ